MSATNPEIQISLATIDDERAVTACLAAYRLEMKFPQRPQSHLRSFVGALLLAPSLRVVLARQGTEVVGFAIFALSISTSRLQRALYCSDIWIQPRLRSRGVGGLILQHGKEYAETQEAPFLYGIVDPRRTSVVNFLTQNGWSITSLAFMFLEGAPDGAADDSTMNEASR